MTREDLTNFLEEISKALAGGFGLSGLGAVLLPEVIHAIFVVITGFVGAIVIYFTNRFLKKMYP